MQKIHVTEFFTSNPGSYTVPLYEPLAYIAGIIK